MNRFWNDKILYLALVLLGCVITGYGLSQLTWPKAITFQKDAFGLFLAYLFGCGLFIILGAWRKRLNPYVLGLIICAGLMLLSGNIWPFLVTLLFALSSFILGELVLSVSARKQYNGNLTFNFLVGAGIYGTIISLLAHFPVNYPGTYAVIIFAPPLLRWRRLSHILKQIWDRLSCDIPLNQKLDWIDFPIIAISLVYIVVALMPEVGYDALASHLFIPTQLAGRHQWGFDVGTYVWAVMPFLGDCIYAIGYMLAGETAARLINVGFILVLCWLIRELVLWSGGKVKGTKWAVLIFLSTPLTFTEGSTLYIESIWASFLVAGIFAVLRICSLNDHRKGEITAAGILLGCGLATKMLSGTVFPILLVVLVYSFRNWLKPELNRELFFGLLLLVVLGIIPYARSYFITGNPAFPFFNQIFKSSYFPINNFSNPLYKSGITWDLIYRMAFDSVNYLESTEGASGFQWLILLVPTVVMMLINRHWEGIKIAVIAVAAIAVTFHFQSYLRFIFPFFVLLSAILGLFFSEIHAKFNLNRKFICSVTGIAIGLNILFLNAGAFYRDFPLKSVTSASERKNFLQNRLPIRNAVELVNDLNGLESPVAVFAQPMTAGLNFDALYPNWYNHEFQKLIMDASRQSEIADILMDKNADLVILDDYWSTNDKRLLIKQVTVKISQIGSIQVRRLKKELFYKTELLTNPDFKSAGGWQISDGAKLTPGVGAVVTVESNISQAVTVIPGRRYFNIVKSRCEGQAAQGRVQINWFDSTSRFISTDIRVFDCSNNSEEHSMEVICPSKAITAVVYCSGHTSIPVLFESNSLRK